MADTRDDQKLVYNLGTVNLSTYNNGYNIDYKRFFITCTWQKFYGIDGRLECPKDCALSQTTLSPAGTAPDLKGRPDTVAIDSLAAFLSMPGYLIRRSKQTSTFIFTETCKDFGITPIQFAAMAILRFKPGIDQTALGEIAALDPSTAGDVIQRLERRKLVQRREQGQSRICNLTAEGIALLEKISPLVVAAQSLILDALTSREQAQLLRLLSKMNGVSNLHHTTHKMRRRHRRYQPASR